MCVDVDVDKNVKHAHWHEYTRKKGQKTTVVPRALLGPVHHPICSSVLKTVTTYPPPHPTYT